MAQATECRKVFVTGVYASGKTRFARAYGRKHRLPCVDFDNIHAYGAEGNQSRKILAGLPERFVIDAIPIDENGTWNDFIGYEARNEVLVVCVYCPDRGAWLRRVHRKGFAGQPARLALDLLVRWLRTVRHGAEPPLPVDADFHLRAYRDFFRQTRRALDGFRTVRYYDTCRGEYTSREEMLERVGSRYFPLEEHLDGLGKEHDRKYQDIEILNFKGYTESHKTWERIADLVEWRGKKVLDLGCFHGYFCFKAEDAGAEVEGLDRSPPVLEVARMINGLRGGKAVFRTWVGGDDLPGCDLLLCLNVLHHFDDPAKAVLRMKCREAVFEIRAEDRPVVAARFDVVREVPSHRSGRTILLCVPRGGGGGEARDAGEPGRDRGRENGRTEGAA